jgi:hypothetical protein
MKGGVIGGQSENRPARMRAGLQTPWFAPPQAVAL